MRSLVFTDNDSWQSLFANDYAGNGGEEKVSNIDLSRFFQEDKLRKRSLLFVEGFDKIHELSAY